MNAVFVDTSAWYALVDSDDNDHAPAVAYHCSNSLPLVTTNAVFSETVTLIRYRLGHVTALTFGNKLKESSLVRIVNVSQLDEERSWEIFTKYRDQDFSFADCTSFAVMQRMEIGTAFTFDRHFRVMKFEVMPR